MMFYYQHHIGDFIKATARLTDSQTVGYLRLIWMYYDSEKPLQNDIDVLAMQIGLSPQDTHLLLRAFFKLENNVWIHTRCDAEIAEYHEHIAKKSNAGRASAERRKNKSSTGVEQVLNECSTDEQLTNNRKPLTNNQEPYLEGTNVPSCPLDSELDSKKAEQKIPGCDHKGVIDLYHTYCPTLPRVEVWNDQRAGFLRQRWREVAIDLAKTQKPTREALLDWWKDFFQFVAMSEFLTGKTPAGKDRKAFLADLEWLVRPGNFAKVIENRYHRK